MSIVDGNLYFSTRTPITPKSSPCPIAAVLMLLCIPALGAEVEDTHEHAQEITSTVVSASRTEIEAKFVDTVRPSEEPDHLSVVDLFRSIPGLAVTTAGNPAALSQIRIRGAEANHTLVLIDGINANDPASEFNFGAMTDIALERVEILRGSSSSIWGSDALAGVIYFDTRPTRSQLRADLDIGTQDAREFSADWSLKEENKFGRLSLIHRQNSGFNANNVGDEPDGFDQQAINLHGGIVQFGWDTSVAIRWLDSLSNYDPYLGDGPLQVNTQRTTFVAKSSYVSSELWTPRLQFAKSRTLVGNLSDGARTNHSVGTRTVLSWDNRFVIEDTTWFLTAVEMTQQDYRLRAPASIFGNPNQDQETDQWGLALEYRTSFENVTIHTSARQDWNSNFSHSTTWNTRVDVPIADVHLFASIGTGIKNPTFTELFGYFPGSFVGNPQLEPETSLQWQFGSQFAVNDINVEATLFDANLENEINGFVYSPAAAAFTTENVSGESQRRGVEISVETQWRRIGLQVGYAFVDSEENGKQEIRRPNHSGSIKVRVNDWNQWGFTIGVIHTGEQFDTDFGTFPSRQVELLPFNLVTIACERTVTESLRFRITIENALDEEYEEVLNYVGPGLSIRGGLRVAL